VYVLPADVVSERGDEAVERVRELTDGLGAHSVLECVGLEPAVDTALEIARPGGGIGRVGIPEQDTKPTGVAFWKNAGIAGGPAPVRAYIEGCCRTCSRDGSNPAGYSTALARSTRCPTATAR
jgi:threonine dehydrogenase-like Zn-dependent dehydrogenase